LGNSTIDFLTWKGNAHSLYIIFSDIDPDRLIFRIDTSPISWIFISYDIDLSVGWHHVAAVFDNEYTASEDLMVLYLDGSRVTIGGGFDLIPGTINSSSALNIGSAPINPLVGWMEEIRLSDIVRYSGVSYTVPTSPFVPDANTRALWHFNEVAGSTAFADSSGNGNTLTGLNGAQTGNP
jgi:hypothetical protein